MTVELRMRKIQFAGEDSKSRGLFVEIFGRLSCSSFIASYLEYTLCFENREISSLNLPDKSCSPIFKTACSCVFFSNTYCAKRNTARKRFTFFSPLLNVATKSKRKKEPTCHMHILEVLDYLKLKGLCNPGRSSVIT